MYILAVAKRVMFYSLPLAPLTSKVFKLWLILAVLFVT